MGACHDSKRPEDVKALVLGDAAGQKIIEKHRVGAYVQRDGDRLLLTCTQHGPRCLEIGAFTDSVGSFQLLALHGAPHGKRIETPCPLTGDHDLVVYRARDERPIRDRGEQI